VLCPLDVNGTRLWLQVAVTISIPADDDQEVSFHELLENHLDWLKGVERMPSLPRITSR
jgi:hypothetical protein